MRADLRQAGVWRDGRLGYRVNLGYRQSEDWSRSRTAYDSLDWAREYAPATSTPPPKSAQGLPASDRADQGSRDRRGTRHARPHGRDVRVRAAGLLCLQRLDGHARGRHRARGKPSQHDRHRPHPRPRSSCAPGRASRGTGLRVPSPRGMQVWTRRTAVSGSPTGVSLRQTERAFHLEGRTSRTFHGNAGRVVVGASIQDNWVNTYGGVPLARTIATVSTMACSGSSSTVWARCA